MELKNIWNLIRWGGIPVSDRGHRLYLCSLEAGRRYWGYDCEWGLDLDPIPSFGFWFFQLWIYRNLES